MRGMTAFNKNVSIHDFVALCTCRPTRRAFSVTTREKPLGVDILSPGGD